jgi:hypothetical protein
MLVASLLRILLQAASRAQLSNYNRFVLIPNFIFTGSFLFTSSIVDMSPSVLPPFPPSPPILSLSLSLSLSPSLITCAHPYCLLSPFLLSLIFLPLTSFLLPAFSLHYILLDLA